jgi:hypothetical protein
MYVIGTAPRATEPETKNVSFQSIKLQDFSFINEKKNKGTGSRCKNDNVGALTFKLCRQK